MAVRTGCRTRGGSRRNAGRVLGGTRASDFFQEWPDSVATTLIRSLSQPHPGNYLAEDCNVPAYEMENTIPFQRWLKAWSFTNAWPRTHRVLSGIGAYRAAPMAGTTRWTFSTLPTRPGLTHKSPLACAWQGPTSLSPSCIPTTGSAPVKSWPGHTSPAASPREGHHGHR